MPERFLGNRPRRDRMGHPFVAVAVDVVVGAERPHIERHLGALIGHRAAVAAERHAVLVALEEVLPELRTDAFEDEAEMRQDRIVAQDGVGFLEEVDRADDGEEKGDAEADRQQDRLRVERQGHGETHGRKNRQGERDEARGEGQKEGRHHILAWVELSRRVRTRQPRRCLIPIHGCHDHDAIQAAARILACRVNPAFAGATLGMPLRTFVFAMTDLPDPSRIARYFLRPPREIACSALRWEAVADSALRSMAR